jgi:hypothetical protein
VARPPLRPELPEPLRPEVPDAVLPEPDRVVVPPLLVWPDAVRDRFWLAIRASRSP